MLYAAVALERAMKVQEVICRVLAGTLTWLQGADILGIHTRSLRRWRARYERDGVLGLYDGRRGQPSRRKAPSRRSNASCACIASATARATGTPASYTPTAGGKVDLTRPTQLGHALTRLGIVHIPSYSPQGRGRGERLNRTLQGRLINELRVAGITTVEAANLHARALPRRLRRGMNALVTQGRLVAQRRVAPPLIVTRTRCSRTPPGRGPETPPIEQLALQGREEALAQRVVVGVADRPHRRPDAERQAALPVGDGRVLTTMIRMVDDAVGTALFQGHVHVA